jgi:uncharacterized protein
MDEASPDTGEGPRRHFRVRHAALVAAVALVVAVGATFDADGGDEVRRAQATVLALAPMVSVVIELAPVADGPPPVARPEAVNDPAPIQALPPQSDPVLTPAAPVEAPVIPPFPERQAMLTPRPTPAAPRIIAVVIDDLGLDRPRSRRAIALPGPLTMALLPFAVGSAELGAAARAAGHEVIAHLPMEAIETDLDPGPMALLASLSEPELLRRLRWHLDRYGGFAGASNHMGSRFTTDGRRMGIVLGELKARGMFWLDSRTNGRSVGECLAHRLGVEATARDVFLDNDPSVEAVLTELRQVEQIARRHGRAVAIGHPREGTLMALQYWLPRMRQQGFEFRPVSALLSTANAACKAS